jgi:hypothetical protein
MKRVVFVLAIAILFMVAVAGQSYAKEATEYEVLVNELVKEKIITQEKANEILSQIDAIQKKAEKEGKNFELPKELEWLKRLKFSGDLRVRYQLDKTEGSEQRHRGRYRFRFGVQAKITDDILLAAGLATGGSDPRSTNQTMQDTFATPDIRFDYGYGQYHPFPWLTAKVGRLKGMPFWVPSDLLWDTDINPDGGAIQLEYPFLKNSVTLKGFFNAGFFILDEWNPGNDPYMYVFQPGFDAKLKDFSLKAAFTYYGFENVKDHLLDNSSGTNTRLAGPVRLRYNYDSVGVGAELGYNKPFGVAFIPYVGVLGEYIYNPDPSSNNNGFGVGAKIGHKKVAEKGSWSVKYIYRYLERDAWLDTFPDSDALGGRTNARGHEVEAQYALFKHVTVGADYYNMIPIKGYPRNTEQIFQLDLSLWF